MTKQKKILLKSLLKQYKQTLNQDLSDYPKLKRYEKQYEDKGFWGLIIALNRINIAIEELKVWKAKQKSNPIFKDMHQTIIDMVDKFFNK